LLQFHIHAPSEHTIDGKHYDAELHLVHKDTDEDELAVIGVFFDRVKGGNRHNPFIESLRVNDLRERDSMIVPEIPLFEELVRKLKTDKIYNYPGSLTIPPCGENVNWIVVDDPQPISDEQLMDLKTYWSKNVEFAGGNGNNREVQPLHDRIIYVKGLHA